MKLIRTNLCNFATECRLEAACCYVVKSDACRLNMVELFCVCVCPKYVVLAFSLISTSYVLHNLHLMSESSYESRQHMCWL